MAVRGAKWAALGRTWAAHAPGRRRIGVLVGAVIALLASAPGRAGTQDADDGYAPAANGSILAILAQADGHALVGGAFTTIDGQPCPGLCRLTVDGRIAPGFDVRGANGTVEALVLQADGKVVIGGDFSSVLGQPRRGLARLNADGSLDAGFSTGLDAGTVRALALQADGKLLVGGSFGAVGGVERVNLARLFADGRVDPRFNPVLGFTFPFIMALRPLDDGRLLVGGSFQNFGAAAAPNLVRLRDDGSVDSGAELSANGAVRVLVREADGRVVAGGDFTQVGTRIRNRLARLEADGTVSTTGMPFANSTVNSIVVLDDGDLVIGGEFTAVGSAQRSRLARLSRSPVVVASFAPAVDPGVFALAVQPDGQLLVGGYFTAVDGQQRLSLARVGPAGDLDTTLQRNPAESTFVLATATTPDDRILVAGSFNTFGGVQRPAVARLLPGGAIDTAFAPAPVASNAIRTLSARAGGAVAAGGRRGAIPIALRYDSAGTGGTIATPLLGVNVNAMLVDAAGRTVVAGDFSQIAGVARANIARLRADGTLDPGFAAATDTSILSAAKDAELLLIGGTFSSVNGTPRAHLARLTGSGQLDAGFAPAVDGPVFAITKRPFGSILIGGAFQTVAGIAQPHLARLLGNGGLDAAFLPDLDGSVDGLVPQADGGVIVTGAFTQVDGQPRAGIARLRANGRLDPAFAPVAVTGTGSTILTVTVQRDGRLLVGGRFDTLNGAPRRDLARLATGVPALESLRAEGTRVTWQRGGAAAELSDFPTVELSADGVSYGARGQLSPVAGGWRADGLPIAVGEQVFVRISAESAGGYYAGSRSRIERVLRHVVTDRLFRHGFD
jgi:uncharacterized delta-60 repeat protein